MLPGLQAYIEQGATFDVEGFYRYTLYRRWTHLPMIMWLLLNPSTADADTLDATFKKVEKFSRLFGFGGFYVCNAFALRSTTPKALYTGDTFLASRGLVNVGDINPIGERDGRENDIAIAQCAAKSAVIVVGWGTEKIAQARGEAIATSLGRRLYCLRRNADGSPMHPLYVPYSATLSVWKDGAA